MKIEKVLFPTDFSEEAEQAFESAVYLAELHKAQLTLLHVVEQLHGLTHDEVLAHASMDLAEKHVKHAHENLQSLIDRVEDRVSASETVREGSTWAVICDTAEEEGADIIVMASQGRTGLAHALIGSIAEKVVRHANCPVLVVRQKRE